MATNEQSREHVRNIRRAQYRAHHPGLRRRRYTPGASEQARRLRDMMTLILAREKEQCAWE